MQIPIMLVDALMQYHSLDIVAVLQVRKMTNFSNLGLANLPSKEVLSVGLTCFYCQKSADSDHVSSCYSVRV